MCISNCDKITPGMLLAAMRLNIPVVFVSGGPMEAGKAVVVDGKAYGSTDLITAMSATADDSISEQGLDIMERSACPTCGSCSGMFTANSMNCLTEALGLSLPGNGTTLATHAYRKELFQEAGRRIVDLCQRYYQKGDDSVLPRNIATKNAFRNAIALDIAMGGSTNTILHTLAAAIEGEIDFTLNDIEDLSARCPASARSPPRTIPTTTSRTSIAPAASPRSWANWIAAACWSPTCTPCTVRACGTGWTSGTSGGGKASEQAMALFHAAPGGVRTTEAFSTENVWDTLDLDAAGGCIRDLEHAYTKDGGLAVLYGNLALDGSVIKSAGIDESLFRFVGPAVVVDSQEEAVEKILNKTVKEGDVVVIRFEGPKGGPGMQEMLYPTSFLKGRGLGKACALITDGRFSGGTSGISVGHISPEAAGGGVIGLVHDGDEIVIDIHERQLHLNVSDEELARRRQAMGELPWKPANRQREVSKALKVYAKLVRPASFGAVREID